MTNETGRKAGHRLACEAESWHCSSSREVAAHWRVDPRTGLTGAEAAERLQRYGPNSLREKQRLTVLDMLAHQFSDFMIIVLIIAAVISGILGDIKDAVAIVVIILLNGGIGFVQEFRTARAMAALARIGAGSAILLRDATQKRVSADEVVPGDVVSLEAGNIVPADLRLIDTAQLKIDESMLTGESVPVEKIHALLHDPDLGVGDRWNMAYKGTPVSHGRGRGIVVATGMKTEVGKIAALLEEGEEPKTPLQKRLAGMGQRLAMISLGICLIIFVIGLMRGEPMMLMFMTSVSLAVAAIPEALPAVVSIVLALGARKMVQLNALIRRLPAMETLGSVTTICSDKTGTLTKNQMEVTNIFAGATYSQSWPPGPDLEPWRSLFQAMALNNDASHSPGGDMIGDPTETALLAAARQAGFDKAALEEIMPRRLELPFESDRKRMTTFHASGKGFIAYTKGAPEMVIPHCRSVMLPAGETALDPAEYLKTADKMAAEGMRVLAVAQRYWPALGDDRSPEIVERDLVLLGLVGLMDPPRPEALEAVRQCATAGIVPVMITGDHPATARAIASQLGILSGKDLLVTGVELARMTDEELFEKADNIRVYARVSPAQKIRIVEALQARGECTAMTGDGVNDAPALQRADIGVAMGKGGTDVAREAASLILLDDNFATIVVAVREGRRIYDNIRKFVRFTMTGNSGEVGLILLAPLLGLPMPLLPLHILWINLVTDGLPGLALAIEPAEPGIMQRPPRRPDESIFAHGLGTHIIWSGLAIAGLCLFAQAFAIQSGWAHWQTMAFTVLALAQMAHVMAVRSEREPVWRHGLFSNMPLVAVVLLTIIMQLAIIYVPGLNKVFSTAPLTGPELALCLGLSSTMFIAVEVEKWLVRKGWLYAEEEKPRPASPL